MNWFKKFTLFDESTTQTSSSTAPISETNKRTMKSAWAYNNGKRMMKEAKASLMSETTGWIKRGGTLIYAERYIDKLMVKTYANKKQADNKILKLKELGHAVFLGAYHPYTILKAQ